MSRWRKATVLACLSAAIGVTWTPVPSAQTPRGRSGVAAFAAGSLQDLRQWDPIAESMLRSGELRVRQVRQDTQFAARTR